MDYLRIANWAKWQSYRRDRGQPPWIKIHRCVMRNPDWVSLTDGQRGQLVAIWLLAADRDGVIPASPDVIRKLCHIDSGPDLKTLMDKGFIEHDATLASSWRQHDATETETETEKKDIVQKTNGIGKTEHADASAKRTTEKEFLEFWAEYPRKIAKQAAQKAYAKARRSVSHETIIAGLRRAKPGWHDPKFIPHASTWINGCRWDDDFNVKPTLRSLGIV